AAPGAVDSGHRPRQAQVSPAEVADRAGRPMSGPQVCAVQIPGTGYPAGAPYHPSVVYPEYPFGSAALAGTPNEVYGGVRELLRELGLDRERFGAAAWNPLGGIVRPGTTVGIKPNFVLSRP